MSALNEDDSKQAQAAAGDTAASAPAAASAQTPSPGMQPAADNGPRRWWQQASLWLALLALALVVAQWWASRDELRGTQQQVAARLAETDTVAKESRALARQNQEQIENIQGKMGAMEATVAESRSQQLALESMYQELSRSGEDRLVAEVEDAINAAVQQLHIGGHVEGALLALQNADTRLGGTDNPVLLPLRKAVIRDIETLKALPLIDVAGVSSKLETIIAAIDEMPLANTGKPRIDPPPPEGSVFEPVFWRAMLAEVWRELRQLVRVERLDRPEPVLLAPEHAFFLRENLKLRLINARLALLQRDTASFRDDLRMSRQWLDRHFDTTHRSVTQALATMAQLADTDLQLSLPTLDASRTALHKIKTGRNKAETR